MTRIGRLALLLLLVLSACGTGDDSGTDGLRRDEAQRLDAAAAATDINAIGPANASEPGQ